MLKAESTLSESAKAKHQLRNSTLSLTVEPAHGLCVSRIDYYPSGFNWADVLARRPEHYHYKLAETTSGTTADEPGQASIHELVRVKEPGLQRLLYSDPHPRHSFVTFQADVESPDQFLLNDGNPVRMFAQDWYTGTQPDSNRPDHLAATLSEPPLTKSIQLTSHGAVFSVSGKPDTDRQFFVEFNVTVLTDAAPDRYIQMNGQTMPLNAPIAQGSATTITFVDEWQGKQLTLHSSLPGRLLGYPVYTVSSSEAGFERTYQGTCILFGFDPTALRDGITIEMSIEEL
jgi:alpha-amylase